MYKRCTITIHSQNNAVRNTAIMKFDSSFLFVFLLYIDRNTNDCIWCFVIEMHGAHTQNHNKYKT